MPGIPLMAKVDRSKKKGGADVVAGPDGSKWRSRIVRFDPTVEPEQLLANPDNWRIHPFGQRAALEGVLDAVGWVDAVKVNVNTGHVVDGHARIESAISKGTPVPVLYVDLDPEEEKAVLATFDQIGALAGTDHKKLEALLAEAALTHGDLIRLVSDAQALADSFAAAPDADADDSAADVTIKAGLTDPDSLPEERVTAIAYGDVYALGAHRLMCGDSISATDVARLVDGRTLGLFHADPPYGMGKEADGVANDNLYDDKFDAFQMAWLGAWTPHWAPNGSAYVWGNAPDLWRLWYRGGLSAFDELMVRNEIVWDKGSGRGMAWDGAHSFPPATERCLFLMRGTQFLGNQNTADYFEGYEPLRAWLAAERDKAGWTNRDVDDLTGVQMSSHWFTKSQFSPLTREHYEGLQRAAAGRAFDLDYDNALFTDAIAAGKAHRRQLQDALSGRRSYFDNTHAAMTDVWQFGPVVGAERYGHATPKPVELVRRAILSSAPFESTIGVPFGGTCPEIIAAEQTGRACVIMELQPSYCQIVIDRWEAFTGQRAEKLS